MIAEDETLKWKKTVTMMRASWQLRVVHVQLERPRKLKSPLGNNHKDIEKWRELSD